MQSVKLHLGAHKTATTYIQKQLEMNAIEFLDDQIYLPLQEMRETFTALAISSESKSSNDLRSFLHKLGDYSTLILSDENILGTAALLRDGILYRDLEKRCRKIANAFLGDVKIEVVFLFRDYRDFISSLYCEYIRNNTICRFEEYLSLSNYKSIDWVAIHEILVDVFGEDCVYFFNFEKFPVYEPRIMENLLPKGSEYVRYDLGQNAATSRASFPASAIQFLVDSQRYLDSDGVRGLVRMIDNSCFRDNWLDGSKYRPLAGDEYLRDKYFKDLDVLKKRGCFV